MNYCTTGILRNGYCKLLFHPQDPRRANKHLDNGESAERAVYFYFYFIRERAFEEWTCLSDNDGVDAHLQLLKAKVEAAEKKDYGDEGRRKRARETQGRKM